MGVIEKLKLEWQETVALFSMQRMVLIALGTAALSFGIYNIHQQSGVSEGGVLGAILLLHHWFRLPSSFVSPLLDLLCYVFAFKYLGKNFIKLSLFSSISLASFFRLWELSAPVLPNYADAPLMAAILGGLFVGVGVGIIVRQGGSSGGDDALALVISKLFHIRISKAYLTTDLTVLLLSLSYISWQKIIFSLITVTLSSYLIDFIKSFSFAKSTAVSKVSVSKVRKD
ncbi:YitT family protein [Vagococcus acidifermentans]|uniref:YitT family protein n=1 Tax=Vagococcus acidifermentans TaxID=564710 RepID=A0A430AN05_9ENTE|nr:YitT family protein [Vagococcus acidifermentans]RSU09498.1 hypothetical protein CBF27_12365 [Vagococcus acidifermentans]